MQFSLFEIFLKSFLIIVIIATICDFWANYLQVNTNLSWVFQDFWTFTIVDIRSKFDFLVPVSVLTVNNLTFSDNQLVSVLITDSLIRFDLMVTSKSLATLSNHF